MMKETLKYVGMDVHKKTIDIAIAEEGCGAEVRHYGTINNDTDAINKILRKLLSTDCELRFAYEAGPCGYHLHRYLTENNLNNIVVAPSLIPRKSGDRVKTDRKDAISLARLLRAGELTAVYVPAIDDEAMRDLTRAKEDATIAGRKAKQHLSAFLLRHGKIYTGKSTWSKAHFGWIADLKMLHPAQQIVLQEYVRTVTDCSEQVTRMSAQIQTLLAGWRMAPVVKALQALRGVSTVVAITTIAELGDLSRFDHPSKLMAYLGLVPSEHSSGASKKRGGITKTGNSHVRRVLTEAAHSYRLPARISRVILGRQNDLSAEVKKIAWDAQVRLCARYQRLIGRGKETNVVVTAIAREIAAFMWAIAKQVRQSA